MGALEVLSCGPGLTVQDAGRTGYLRFGVPTAGAMDRAALALANALVGNAPEAAALELPFLGATFRMRSGATVIGAAGAGAVLAINEIPVPAASAALVRAGDRVAVSPACGGVYTYLAIAGGIAVAPEMGSRSSHMRTGFGPAQLAAGDHVPLADEAGSEAALRYIGAAAPGDGPIRVVPGPQDSHFGEGVWAAFLGAAFRVSARSDRMGLRLDGPRLPSARGHDIVSEGVVPGSIQVPGDGQPIVLGRDCQTTGGYPKIATVISADLGRLAQFPPGAEIRFRTVSADEAIEAARSLADWVAALPGGMRSARTEPAELTRHNLISGITDARGH
ncbi:MAG: biotin-dependent carboxyltransferase family protein [Pseudomonadota bacterium]